MQVTSRYERYLARNRSTLQRHRANLSQLQREEARERNVESQQRSRANETEERRATRLNRDRQWHQDERDAEPPRPRGRRRNVNEVVLTKAAFKYDVHTFNLDQHKIWNIGSMSKVCQYCQAKLFEGEPKGMCCKSGKVADVPKIPDPPEEFLPLFDMSTSRGQQFLKNSRKYNQAFNMTSFRSDWKPPPSDGWMPTFKVGGHVYHTIGPMTAREGQPPSFLQIFFTGNPEQQVNQRLQINDGCDKPTLEIIQDYLHQHNPYIQRFRYLYENDPNINERGARMVIRSDRFTNQYHQGTLNAPRDEDFAACVTDENTEGRDRDIHIYVRHGERQQGNGEEGEEGQRQFDVVKIGALHRSYDALQYPLLLHNGQDGYDMTKKEKKLTKTTSCQFYSYQIMVRQEEYNPLLRLGYLFSQYVVDQYAKVEQERLNFQRRNQETLRASSYKGLYDSVEANVPMQDIGTPVILSPSFVGGPRYYHNKTQDALSYVRVYGKPDLFITMTANPKWEEIKRELFTQETDGPQLSQESVDREDITTRVFNQKKKTLVEAIDKGIFGKCVARMHSIEWQKRGLPHVHLLVWLEDEIRPADLDDIISAQIPNPEEDPELYNLVKTWMIHGPCGNRCKDDSGNCTKNFPKPFMKETKSGHDGYPLHKRLSPEDGGFKIGKTTADNRVNEFDNRHVVPYNPYLLRILDCHTNVEYVGSISAIKYVTKYVNKVRIFFMFEFEIGIL